MGHAKFKDEAPHTGDTARVGGPIDWDEDDTDAVIYAMVCQSLGHENTVGREVTPVKVTPGTTEWEIELKRRPENKEPFVDGMAAATALAIFTNTEGEFASYSWTDCVHLKAAPYEGSSHGEGHASH